MPPSSESATLPWGFRFHYQDGENPKTPEPTSRDELQQPSPPRGPRLRVKRRNASRFSGPTEQFLASVAAADIPLPTIEIPQTADDVDMIDPFATPNFDTGFLAPQTSQGDITRPRTPAPQLFTSMEDASSHRRDWYMSTPDDGTGRPSSSLSEPSDWSDDSYFSASRVSRPSNDSSCTSPDDDILEPFLAFPGKGKEPTLADVVTSSRSNVLNGELRSKSRNDAPWSKEMSEHLWQTYQVYLQDPTVTPFRIGASAVPPNGVIHRVAREAKRSWKGPKAYASRVLEKRSVSSVTIDSIIGSSEGASSPDNHRNEQEWQYNPYRAATRHHLRELCKRKDSLSVQKHRHLQSRSPTPFSQTRRLSRDPRRSKTQAPQNAFSTKDIAISLATSTSLSMQPDGPLVKLNKASEPLSENLRPANPEQGGDGGLSPGITVDSAAPSRRLKSPFQARTYGPSTSNIFSTVTPSPSEGGPRLRSPLRFKQARSLNGTQKRRAQHALEEELSPNGAVVRPSILDEQIFGGPLENRHRRVRVRGFSLGDAASRSRIPGLFQAQAEGTASLLALGNTTLSSARQITPLLPAAEFSQPRVTSSISEGRTSNTFPRKPFQSMDKAAAVQKRHPATIHHTRHSIESFDFGEGPSLQSRLTQPDERIAEIRQREAAGFMRSED